MPELPEVENICRKLANRVIGATINKINIKRHDLRIAIPKDFAIYFTGKKITNVGRKAKYILINTENNGDIIIHLGMSGKVFIESEEVEWKKHEHVRFYLDNGIILRYIDVRRFGLISYNTDLLSGIGLEPLDANVAYYMQKAAKRKQPVKNFLMDQKLVVGIGNIYASEILFAAGVLPTRPACEVTEEEWEKIVKATNHILNKAIELGGSTIKDFADANGKPGGFQLFLKVYGKENKLCLCCAGEIQKIKQAGRSTFMCPNCQR